MVGSSLRRHPKQTHQHDSITNNDQEQDHPALSLRSKRLRGATVSDQDQNKVHKRRKVLSDRPQPLRIPLRGKPAFPQSPVDPNPDALLQSVPPTPTGKPQYDQIRIIEEKARRAIASRNGSDVANAEDHRKLRKHGGTRTNTELAQYFPNFQEMLSLEPSDPDALTAKTKVILTDDTPDYVSPPPKLDPFGCRKPLHNTTSIDLRIPKITKKPIGEDPMREEVYQKIHKKHERHEKQMKNGDREKAQHEKYQLERLLEELRGPDWLKTLGISGITETEKKRYEPKRLLFLRETQAMLTKFNRWKEEEKRRKLQREEELREEHEEAEAEEDGEQSSSRRSASTQPPNSSEIDALASQQLLEEAKSANKRKKIAQLQPVLPLPEYKPFTSFFEKRHIRDAAVSGRQRGRTVLAFGQPVPDLWEEDFVLPEDILTEDAIRASQRRLRRRQRDIDE